MKKQLKSVSNQQLKRIRSAGVRAGSRAVRSGKRLIRPLDSLLRKSRLARLLCISGFVVGSLFLTSLLGYHITRMIWSEEATGGEAAAVAPLPIEPVSIGEEGGEIGEFKPSGELAGDLSLLNLVDQNNQTVSLSSLPSRLLVINFWATWCASCVQELPKIEQLATVWKNRGVHIVAVALDQDGWEKVKPFLETHRIRHLPVVVDRDQTAMASFNLRGLPTTVFVNGQGKDLGRIAGDYDWHSTAAMNLLQRLSQQKQ